MCVERGATVASQGCLTMKTDTAKYQEVPTCNPLPVVEVNQYKNRIQVDDSTNTSLYIILS